MVQSEQMEDTLDSTVTVANKHKNDYTQEDRARAVALAQSEQNMASAADTLGIPLSTLSEWCRGLYGRIDPYNPLHHSLSVLSGIPRVSAALAMFCSD